MTLAHCEDVAKTQLRRLVDVYTEQASYLNVDFGSVSLPDLDLDDDGRPDIEQEVNSAIDRAQASAAFVNSVEPVGDLAGAAGGSGGPGGGGAGDPDDDGPRFLPEDQDPSNVDPSGPGTALTANPVNGPGGGAGNAIPFRPDVAGGAANPGLIRPGGSSGAGTGLASFGPGVMPYGLGAGAGVPTNLAGQDAGTGAGGKLAELNWKTIIGLSEVAPPGVISSPPNPSTDDDTQWA
jgi:hypothetical protein